MLHMDEGIASPSKAQDDQDRGTATPGGNSIGLTGVVTPRNAAGPTPA